MELREVAIVRSCSTLILNRMSDLPAPRRVEEHLCFALYAAQHAFNAAYKPLLEPLGLTYTQYLVLLVLWERDGLTVKDLALRLHLDSGTLTPVLKRMERSDLISRERKQANQREVRIELTAKGRALRSEAGRIYDSLACRLGGTEDSLAPLLSGLQSLAPQLRGPVRE
jgi:DNA-binding MarR family transcriptional regulator